MPSKPSAPSPASTAAYRSLDSCVCCHGTRLQQYLDLGEQPLANSFHDGTVELPRYPLAVRRCEDCGHSQLSVAVDPEAMFAQYAYVSGTTRTLRKHFQELVADTGEFVGRSKLRVLDVGANDGSLMAAFKVKGHCAHGVDPAINLVLEARRRGHHIWHGYWTEEAAERQMQTFDVITALNVLGHTAEPQRFLKACEIALKPGGILVLEFPYGGNVLQGYQWDQFYTEHISTFLVSSLLALVRSTGWSIVRLVERPVHGGSLRVTLQRVRGEAKLPPSVGEYLDREILGKLLCPSFYRDFGLRVERTKEQLRAEIRNAKNAGMRTIAYGASAKGQVVLNACGIDLDYIIEDNPMKVGLLTPGRNIPIKGAIELANETSRLAIVALAWNFAGEIKECLRAVRDTSQDLMIHYVPSVRVESL